MVAAYHHRWWKLSSACSRRHRRPEEHHQARHPECAAHLSRRLVDGAADGEPLGVQVGHRGRAQHREREADAQAGHQRGRAATPSGTRDAMPTRSAYQTRALAKTAKPTSSTGRKPMRPASLPAGPDTTATTSGPGVTASPATQDRVVPDAGEEQDVAQQHGEEAHGVEQRRQVGHGEGPGPEQREVEDGLGVAGRPTEEQRQQRPRTCRVRPGSPRSSSPSPGPPRCRAPARPAHRRAAPRRGSPATTGWWMPVADASTRRPTSHATRPTGRLTKKAERQPNPVISSAPSDGPVATASAPIPPQSATTCDRWLSG